MRAPVTVVTGAGRGLGLALACECAARGARVAVLTRNTAALDSTATDRDLLVVSVDVSKPTEVRAAFAEVRDRLGPVEVLINNAAIYPLRDFLDETVESFMHTVGVNLGGQVACTREALDDMVRAGRGRILNVMDHVDLAPMPASSAYSVSKGAARLFTRALLADLGDRFPDIIIGDWVPGVLATRMGSSDGIEPAEAARWGADLALNNDPALSGVLFERDHEVPPARRFRTRLVDRILGRRQKLRRLGGASLPLTS